MADIFSGAYTSNGGRGGLGSGGGGDKSSHGVDELHGLTWQGDHGLEDSGSGISSSGISSSGGGGDISPRRRSYLWKRPTTKHGAGITSGGGQSGASTNSLLRPKSAGAAASASASASVAAAEPAATAATAALETGVTNELFDGSFFTDRREDQGAAAALGVDVGERGEGSPSAAATAVAAVVPATGGEAGEDIPERAMMGGGGGGSSGAVQLMGGITDGGQGHRFRVRGASFLDDGLEVSQLCLVKRRVLCSYCCDYLSVRMWVLRYLSCTKELRGTSERSSGRGAFT